MLYQAVAAHYFLARGADTQFPDPGALRALGKSAVAGDDPRRKREHRVLGYDLGDQVAHGLPSIGG